MPPTNDFRILYRQGPGDPFHVIQRRIPGDPALISTGCDFEDALKVSGEKTPGGYLVQDLNTLDTKHFTIHVETVIREL